jgi:hypothetical protein
MKIEVGGERTRKSVADMTDKIRALAASIGERYTIKLAMPDADADHLRWFDGGVSPHQPARAVFVMTPDVRARATEAVGHRVRTDLANSGRINTLVALQAGAQAVREVWVERLSTNGAGLAWAPLSPRYAMRKHRRGLDPRMGVARGNMLASVRSGLVVVQRIG